jgi:hypothetical protein
MDKQPMLRGYFSHPIRGRKGAQCSAAEIEANCTKAAQDGMNLMSLLGRFMPVTLYIPGVHDEFVQKAYKAGRLTEEEILDTDCDIIAECDFIILYDWQDYISSGMKYELEYAMRGNIPYHTLTSMVVPEVWKVMKFLLETMEPKLETNTVKLVQP